MDKLTIIGNLGQDPEMRYTPNGKAVTNFSVASNHKWTGADGEKHEQTV
jgi:single-strand DNA-binding protein